MKMNRIKLSIIVVYYSGVKSLKRLISSIYSFKVNCSFEVIVVDNSKGLNIKRALGKLSEKIKYIKSPKNLGYGAGNNIGAKYSKGNYLLILNPDTELKKGSVSKLVQFLDKNPKCGIVAPNLIRKNGEPFEAMGSRKLGVKEGLFSISVLNKLFPNNPISKNYYIKDLRKDELREAGAVPGSAFMIRKNVFNKAGKFDENIFMYFEENDLGMRVNKLGYRIFINPKSEIIHFWDSQEKKSKKLESFFDKSRFYYFKKHFGIFSALLVEAVNRLSKYNIAFILILAAGSVLRFYKIGEYMNFSGDIGFYYLSARDLILKKTLPLVGIPSSVPILKQGAIWTWILALFLRLTDFNPLSGAYLSAIFGILPIVFIYLVSKKYFNEKIAIIASIITAFSSYLLINDRMPYVTTPIFTLTIIYYWLGLSAFKGKKWAYLFLGIILSLLYQFELASSVIFIITALMFLIYYKRLKAVYIVNFLIGIALGLMPFIIYDIRQGVYIQTLGFAGWLVQKAFESTGNLIGLKGGIYFGSLSTYLKQFIFPSSLFLSWAIFVLFSAFFIDIFFKKEYYSKPKYLFVFVWFLFGILAFFIRGSFSVAYFPLLFFPLIMILSLTLYYLLKRNMNFIFSFLFIFAVSNIFYFRSFNKNYIENYVLNYKKQVAVTDYIINLVNGNDFSFQYIRNGDQFESSGDNFKYLLWYKEKAPIDYSNLKIVLAEKGINIKGGELVKDFVYVKLFKL